MKSFSISSSLESLFFDILENQKIKTLFQPILNLKTCEVLGYEALSRGPEKTELESPVALLHTAELLNKTWELEQLLRTKALENASFIKEKLLFLNIDPNIIKDPNFESGFTKEYLKKLGILPRTIVFELTERSAILNYADFKSTLNHYTDQGYTIAIDDAGSGYSGLRTIYEVNPKYIKIDMDFIRNIHNDSFKQAIVKSLVKTANSANIQTIAEGIETPDELRTVIRLGVDFGQGFLIQKPEPNIEFLPQNVIDIIIRETDLVKNIRSYSKDYHYIHHIMETVETFNQNSICIDLFNYLQKNSYSSVCICENDFPIGIATKQSINSVFAKQYGYSVYSKRPISLIMDCNPLIVDFYAPVYDVAKKALGRGQDNLYDDIIVCKGSKYAGIITMKNLLEYAINYEKSYAKELNPLTSLPGNIIINRVMENTITTERESCIFYADLDNFKVYNDIYGFDQGDKIIKLTAQIIDDTIKRFFPYSNFVGHIGGDDFIFIVDYNSEFAEETCKSIISEFDLKVTNYFNEEDNKRGYFKALDRFGSKKEFNLTAISIAGITGNINKFKTVEKLSANLAILKKEAKKNSKSSYIINNVI